ncbi:MAG: ribosome biogenesis GTPase Der [Chloroflexota bacterium]|nr:ribosome biogenesis GTPase Der [Chloroflexota bacterium]
MKVNKHMAQKALVALVGRPNVGKSTLFNRLVGERRAVTDPIPGTTRDRLFGEFEWQGLLFNVVDTGGIEVYQPRGTRDENPLSEGSIDFVPQIKAQALLALADADIIVLVVDTLQGVTAADLQIGEILRRTEKTVLVAANKADHMGHNESAVEFYGMGLGEVFPLSAIHGVGVGDLLDAVVTAAYARFPELAEMPADDAEEEHHLQVAIVGRPNVGKSSLTNKLLGEERMIVSPIAGTTRDAIDTEINYFNEPVTLIDTAGIRRRGRIEPGVEKFSVLRAMKAIDRADVALLLIDGADGVTDQDQHIAGYVIEAGKSIVLVVNKWDAVEKDNTTTLEFTKTLRQKFDFLPDPPIIFISALTGQRIHEVLATAKRVFEGRYNRLQTADVNRLLRDAQAKHPAPTRGTQRLKLFYGSQVRVAPPLFLFHVNDPQLVHFTYRRFLENQIRETYPFEGTPIRMSFRARDSEDDLK